jgi:hypothetical protein
MNISKEEEEALIRKLRKLPLEQREPYTTLVLSRLECEVEKRVTEKYLLKLFVRIDLIRNLPKN